MTRRAGPPSSATIWDRLTNSFSLDNSPSYMLFEHLLRTFSPYELNPFDINPLRDLVAIPVPSDLRHLPDRLMRLDCE